MALYDPAKVAFLVNGVPITGFAKGTFIEFEFNEPRTSMEVGAQGATNTALSRDRSGKWKVSLQNSSPSNAHLDYIAAQHDLGIAASTQMFGPNGGYSASEAYIGEIGKLGYSEKADDTREWEILGAECVSSIDTTAILNASGLGNLLG